MTTDTATAFLQALGQTEWLPPERLRLYQQRLLERLVRHAHAETDFYRDRLAPLFRPDDSIDWDRWGEIPILTRSEAQENFSALTARSMVPEAGKTSEDTTSGSTGMPFRHLTSDIQRQASIIANERFLRWHEIDPNRLWATIRANDDSGASYPDGRQTTGWRVGHPESRSATLAVANTPIEQQMEWLGRIRPDYLMSYPNNLAEIARISAARGIGWTGSAVFTYGEATTPDARASIVSHFGREPLDRYGATEAGLISATCPHSGKHHVMAELVLLELVDEDGVPSAPGTAGRVILTPFYNHATPLIRFDIGDYAMAAAEPCGCGRSLPLLQAVLGRSRNIFRFRDRTSVWPLVRAVEMQAYVPLRQYQLVQLTPERLELRYVPAAEASTTDIEGLTAYLRRRLHPSVEVTLAPVVDIPRSPSGKYEDCVSLVR